MQKVKSQVNEVIGVMHQNIEKVLDRGAKLDDIEDRTGTFSFFFFFRQRLVPSVFYLAGLKKKKRLNIKKKNFFCRPTLTNCTEFFHPESTAAKADVVEKLQG